MHFLKLHAKTVENCYSEYNVFQNQIYTLPLSDERRREQEERYVDFEALYNDLSINLSALLEAAMPKVEPAPQAPLTVASTSATGYAPQQFIPPFRWLFRYPLLMGPTKLGIRSSQCSGT